MTDVALDPWSEEDRDQPPARSVRARAYNVGVLDAESATNVYDAKPDVETLPDDADAVGGQPRLLIAVGPSDGCGENAVGLRRSNLSVNEGFGP